jgi:hypothetical protein
VSLEILWNFDLRIGMSKLPNYQGADHHFANSPIHPTLSPALSQRDFRRPENEENSRFPNYEKSDFPSL